ncbi:DnaJ-domain-containing protein [Delitschia confertaspora ATCC 74209]|uniref:DnaJ-domain-containing protein n=1 Tax=Delitschia confertaspora ATCC 74209 TaxID=1513339 RepID=A0A9P4MRZ1_9PLEO|nr:DnaJ-domain-containing protein [Delitschia confertaspora ATCC 74209]
MGANQSSGADSASPSGGEVKTSYYELLAVERTATDEEIKKAYRRKALELHPDRNYGDVERTTKLFAEVQVAYEVLSDPQERAWYDSHEGQILRGDSGDGEEHFEHNMKVTTADDITRMLRQFHGGIDYTDSPSGFFGFLRETFDTLAREEEAAADWEGIDVIDYPSFGHKDDTYEDVVRSFYNGWSGFSTKKSFAWKDKYRYSDAEDRRVRRLMEKENKKLRDEGIREFNDAVRTLVAFVRKRDPRYTPNTQTDEERTKEQRARAAAQAARSRAAHAAKAGDAVPEWAMARDPEEEEEETEEEIVEDVFECVACHKTFKSEKQWDAHEKSKKHQKAIQALRRQMQKENRHLNLDEEVMDSGAFTPMSGDQDEDLGGQEGAEDYAGEDASAEEITNGLNRLKVPEYEVEEDEKEEEDDDDDDEGDDDDTVERSHKIPAKPTNPTDSTSSEDEDDEYASRSEIEGRLTGLSIKDTSILGTGTPTSEPSTDSKSTGPKMGKAAQKRAKRAAKQAEVDQSELKHKCAVCNAAFPSKTQMFQHIKDLDHAAPVSVTKGSGGKRGRRK